MTGHEAIRTETFHRCLRVGNKHHDDHSGDHDRRGRSRNRVCHRTHHIGVFLALKGWFLAVPALILAAVGFVIGVLLLWGLVATVDDVADVIERKLRNDDGQER
jgi:hypothetical protein